MRILKINIGNTLLSEAKEMVCQGRNRPSLFLSPCLNSGEELNYGIFIISHLLHFANIFCSHKSVVLACNADIVP